LLHRPGRGPTASTPDKRPDGARRARRIGPDELPLCPPRRAPAALLPPMRQRLRSQQRGSRELRGCRLPCSLRRRGAMGAYPLLHPRWRDRIRTPTTTRVSSAAGALPVRFLIGANRSKRVHGSGRLPGGRRRRGSIHPLRAPIRRLHGAIRRRLGRILLRRS
jgi:hypothetical protein